MKRLRLAWRFKVWPWRVSAEAVRYLCVDADILRTLRELAAKYDWRRSGRMR